MAPDERWWRTPPAVASALIVVGGAFVIPGVAGRTPVIAAVGVAVGTWGLGLMARSTGQLLTSTRMVVIVSIVGAVLLIAAIGVVLWAVDRRSTGLAAFGVTCVALSIVPLGKALGKFAETNPKVAMITGVAAVGIAALLAIVGGPVGIAVAVFVLGFLAVNVGTEPYLLKRRGNIRGYVLAAFGVATAGLLLVLVGADFSRPLVLGVGLVVAALAMLPLSVGWRLLGARPIGAWPAMIIGLLLCAVGAFVWPDWNEPVWMLVVAVVVLGGVALSFSWRGEALVLIVVAGCVVIWSLSDRPDPARLDPNPNAPGRILALGDSYTSGEGSTMFFGGTNVAATNQCRRSSTAYPYLVAKRLGMGLDFYACSGAKTSDIYDSRQMPHSPGDVAGGQPQLDNPIDLARLRVVLLSIGGNDAEFGKIGIACLLPGSCDALREHWLVNVSHIGSAITTALKEIKETVGASTPIVVIPYPLLVSERRCDWSALSAGEHAFLSEFITVLDDRVRHSAAEAGVNFFEPGLFAFAGRAICDPGGPDATVMNFFNLHPQQGSLVEGANPQNWVHGTFHPKPSGHDAIADVLTPWLEPFLARVERGDIPANPPANDKADFTIRRVSSVATTLVDPRGIPDMPECPRGGVASFGTLLPLMDDQDSFQLNASLRDPICYTQSDGSWATWDPTTASPVGDDGQPLFSIEDDGRAILHIQPQLPDSGWRQVFLYTEAHRSGPNAAAADEPQPVQVRIVEFCIQKPGCPYDVSAWMANRIRETGRKTVVPALIVWIGGWLLGLGTRIRFGRPPAAPDAA